jgi:hypothetical protein
VTGTATPPAATPPAAPAPRPLATFGNGDWAGALLANAAGFAAMAALALAPAINGGLDASVIMSARSTVAAVFLYVAMAAGGSASLPGGWLGSVDYSFRPLSITLVGYGLLAWLVLRRLRRGGAASTAGIAGLQGLRVALVHGAALVGVALLSGVGGSPTGHRVPFGDRGADPSFTWSAGVGSTLLNGMLTLAVALVVAAVLGLPGVFSSFERLRAAIAGPVRSLVFLTIASCVVAMLAATVLVLVRGESLVDESLPFTVPIQPDLALPDLALALAGLLILVPNLAAFALVVVLGVPLP